jgi:hypothetical protein
MKFNFELDIDESAIIASMSGTSYDVNTALKQEIRSQVVNSVLSKIDLKSFSDEIQTDFARKVLERVGELSKEKVLSYLSDEAITKKVNDVVRWRTDEFLHKNIIEMFNKMRDEFIFIRKEDYDNEIESLSNQD